MRAVRHFRWGRKLETAEEAQLKLTVFKNESHSSNLVPCDETSLTSLQKALHEEV